MKRTFSILVLSGIVIGIYFYASDSKKSAGFAKYVSRPQPARETKSAPVDISRQIASQGKNKTNIVKIKPKKIDQTGLVNPFDFSRVSFASGERITLLDNLHVVPMEEFVEGKYKVVEKRSSYYLVESDFPVGDSSLTVVAVKGSKYLGVVTGVLQVELFDYSERDTLLLGHNYQIHTEYEHLKVVFYQLDGYEDAKEAYESVKDRVAFADLEILQYERSER